MLMLALRLISKDQGGKWYCLPFVGSNLGVDIFLKKRVTSEKGCVETEDGGTSVHFVLEFQENSMQSLSAFLLFFANKKNSKSFSFIPWLLNFSDLPNYGSNSRKGYILRPLAMRLERSIPPYWGKAPLSIPYSIPLDEFL